MRTEKFKSYFKIIVPIKKRRKTVKKLYQSKNCSLYIFFQYLMIILTLMPCGKLLFL